MTNQTTLIAVINGKQFTIGRIYIGGSTQAPFYRCGILPLRARLDDLIRDIERSQGPEWRQHERK